MEEDKRLPKLEDSCEYIVVENERHYCEILRSPHGVGETFCYGLKRKETCLRLLREFGEEWRLERD